MESQTVLVAVLILVAALGSAEDATSKRFINIGPYDTEAPNPTTRSYVSHPLPLSKFWGENIKPQENRPTNIWWENFVLKNGDQTVNTFPYLFQAHASYVCWCNPRFTESKSTVLSVFTQEWCLNMPDSSIHAVDDYDRIGVKLRYGITGKETGFVNLVQGSPFLLIELNNKIFYMKTINAILEVKDAAGRSYDPNKSPAIRSKYFYARLNNGNGWALYFEKETLLQFTLSTIYSPVIKGRFKVASVISEEAAHILARYSDVHVFGAKVTYAFPEDNKAEIQFEWDTKGSELTPLMLALPHHIESMSSPKIIAGVTYKTIKGTMVAVEGKSWILKEDLLENLWDYPTPIDSDKLESIRSALEVDYKGTTTQPDPYFFGVEIGRLARLVIIAEKLGEKEKAKSIRETMKTALEPWLLGTNEDRLHYDTTYGGIVSKKGIAHPDNDFGQGYYNDHHFHYGYHIFAAAVIGKYEPAFLAKHLSTILTYARDYSNPSSEDKYFTITRNKDWFAGHSWAAGLFEFADSRNQESTSEAVMSYYALALLGDAMNKKEIMQFGKLLLSTEIRSSKTYWHMPTKTTIYPPVFSQNKMVGIIWATKADYATFFGSFPIFIHGIQMLPFLPPTQQLLDKPFIQEEYEIIKNENAQVDWIPYRIMARAIIDKGAAWKEATSGELKYHSGTCKTIMLDWIATRPN